jgi:hypothetical protein
MPFYFSDTSKFPSSQGLPQASSRVRTYQDRMTESGVGYRRPTSNATSRIAISAAPSRPSIHFSFVILSIIADFSRVFFKTLCCTRNQVTLELDLTISIAAE